jgi:hypothetical protein
MSVINEEEYQKREKDLDSEAELLFHGGSY